MQQHRRASSSNHAHQRLPSLFALTQQWRAQQQPTPPSSVHASAGIKEPGELARLAAVTTLLLLPRHRVQPTASYPTPAQLAVTFQRYLDLLRLPPVITHLALYYLYIATARSFNTADALDTSVYSVTRLFVMAYSLADTYLDDNAYSNRSWCQVLADGIDIREWNRAQADMWMRGLRWRLEVSDPDWQRWCSWLAAFWRDRGALQWRAAWQTHCSGVAAAPPVVIPRVVSARSLSLSSSALFTAGLPPIPPHRLRPSAAPASGEEKPAISFANMSSLSQQLVGQSASASVAAQPRHNDDDSNSNSSSLDAMCLGSPDSALDQPEFAEDEFVDMYASSSTMLQPPASRAPSKSPVDAYLSKRIRARAATVSLSSAQVQQQTEKVQADAAAALARAVGINTPTVSMLKTSASAEFRSHQQYDSGYSGGGTPVRQRRTRSDSLAARAQPQRRPSMGRIVAEAAEQWWENSVVRRVTRRASNLSGSSENTPKARMSRKDSAIAGMRPRDNERSCDSPEPEYESGAELLLQQYQCC